MLCRVQLPTWIPIAPIRNISTLTLDCCRNLAIHGVLQYILQCQVFGLLSLETKQGHGQDLASWCFHCVRRALLMCEKDQAPACQLYCPMIRTSCLLKPSDWVIESSSPPPGTGALSGLVSEGAGFCVLACRWAVMQRIERPWF